MDRATEPARPNAPDPARPPWHALTSDEVLDRLDTKTSGLDQDEAAHRLARHGPNRLRAPEPVSPLAILVDQFRSVVVLLLLAATLLAFLIGDHVEAAAIAAVLAINALLGFVVELRARRAMESLLSYQVSEATVVRGGAPRTVPADRLVPGDVVEVGEGEAVPADLRLLEAAGLRTSEAALTGESVPVDKAATPPAAPDAPLADRSTLLHAGTAVASGRGRGVVVATGPDTELGRIGGLLEGIEEGRTPLERRLDQLGHRLIGLTLAIAGVVVASGILRGAPWDRMLETGIALAIAAVPEGLPAVATIALAVGLRRMARRKALARELGAVEALGSTTVVCTDKTGTLTAGEMTATRVVGVDFELETTGTGYTEEGAVLRDGRAVTPGDHPALLPLWRGTVLTPRARIGEGGTVVGDPTDAALLVLARKAGLDPEEVGDALPRAGEVPFSSERRMSASLHREEGTIRGWVKGAPEQVLERCAAVMDAGGSRPLEASDRAALEARNREMAEAGLRVIALAWAPETDDPSAIPRELTFLGLVGMLDPPAPGVAETVARLRDAGIRTVMITGDQGPTARAVASALGMPASAERSLDGPALSALPDAELRERVAEVDVFSRVSPEDKLRIVSALQERDEIVAMLGDGVNDAAALKRADVGVAMGLRGTDVAKETASLVLEDDRFPTIGAAVEEGRVIFDNIRKFVFYLFSCNLAEVLVLLLAGLAGSPLPLLPLQILWLNLVTDTFPALALALEPAETDVMERPPRDPGQAMLSRAFLGSLVFFASLITAVTLGAFVWGMQTGSPERAITLTFMTLALAQLFHLGNARSRGPVLAGARIVANPWALAAVPLVLGLQLLAVYWAPLQAILRTVPLTARDWLVVGGLAAIPAVVGQAVELVQGRRGSAHPHEA